MSFYCEKFVKSGRKTKYCSCCGGTIDKGESSYGVPSECFESTINICMPCYKKCEDLGITDISDATSLYNEEDEENEDEDEDKDEDE